MTFHSILFESAENNLRSETLEDPAFFVDLNLDQLFDAITFGKQEYHLKPFFSAPLSSIAPITYRHEIMQDLENKLLLETINSFARKMHSMRDCLTQSSKLRYRYQKESWFLDAVEIYCDAVTSLVRDLGNSPLESRGFLAFREYITNYAKSDCLTSLLAETKQLRAALSSVQYCLLIRGNACTVRKYESEIDYSAEVAGTFAKFEERTTKGYADEPRSLPEMNHVEAKILNLVAQLYPDIFQNLDCYCSQHSHYLDETIRAFDREIQFYVAYIEFMARFKQSGLKFCYPQMSDKDKEIYDYEGFDLALANKLISEKSPIVCNDFYLKEGERIFVITGPNQGGKTTFARTFGQLHYLACLGYLVPGREARLFLFDRLFTHFEKEEDITNLRGKLKDDLVRIHTILGEATPNSIIIMNEIFTSTTLKDAVFLSKKVMEAIIELDLLCVCVTFLDELASLSEKTVSLVSTIVPDTPALRTYRIVRKPADGLAYAISIAEKHRLTYKELKERIKL